MKMYYFADDEFRGWKPSMSGRLLILLDAFRHQWGKPVLVSLHPNAIGREDGTSQHNYKKWGEVRAIDVMPTHLSTSEDALHILNICDELGFTGIGLYPMWQMRGKVMPGLHLDVRHNLKPGSPATWGGLMREGKQVYVSLDDAIQYMRRESAGI
jgi:hypothetical protein